MTRPGSVKGSTSAPRYPTRQTAIIWSRHLAEHKRVHTIRADLGIAPELEPRPDHASYLGSWLKVLANDKRTIFSSAAHAQRAVAFLHGLQPAASAGREPA